MAFKKLQFFAQGRSIHTPTTSKLGKKAKHSGNIAS